MPDQITHLGLYPNTIMGGVWIFILGSCIGSFLNVVIYRLPAGLALSHPPSRCPACETQLAARDNIPILGWFLLRGKCRYCSLPISPRYPLIETLTGVIFLMLFLLETNTSGSNLPLVPFQRSSIGFLDSIFRTGYWELAGWFLLHALYLTLALAVCMISLDGHVPPMKLVTTGVVVAVVCGVIWPGMRPLHTLHPMPAELQSYWGVQWLAPTWLGNRLVTTGIGLTGLVDALSGLASGVITGWLAATACGSPKHDRVMLQSLLLLAGVFCGWQMTWGLLTVLLFILAALAGCSEALQRSTLSLLCFAVCASLLLYWSRLLNGITLIRHDGWLWTPAPAAYDWLATMALLSSIALGLGVLHQRLALKPTDEVTED